MTIINLCKRSTQHFINIMEKSNTNRILIGVKGGGCNGLKYYIEPLNSKPDKTDEIIKLEENKELVVCGKSLLYLIGTNIKWKDDLLGSGIEFENPNAKSSCGCGDTFSL